MSQNKEFTTLVFNNNRPRLWTSILAALLIAIGSYYFYNKPTDDNNKNNISAKGDKQKGRRDAPIPVSVETVKSSDFPIYLNGLGTVTALRTVTVKPRVDGELVKVNFTEGQVVKQGDLLAEIDPRPFDIQLQQVEGQLLRDEALLKNAQLDQQRYQKLLEQD